MIAWVVIRTLEGGPEFAVDGVFSTRERASVLCTTDAHAIIPLDLDRDYTNVDAFTVLRPSPVGHPTQ